MLVTTCNFLLCSPCCNFFHLCCLKEAIFFQVLWSRLKGTSCSPGIKHHQHQMQYERLNFHQNHSCTCDLLSKTVPVTLNGRGGYFPALIWCLYQYLTDNGRHLGGSATKLATLQRGYLSNFLIKILENKWGILNISCSPLKTQSKQQKRNILITDYSESRRLKPWQLLVSWLFTIQRQTKFKMGMTSPTITI